MTTLKLFGGASIETPAGPLTGRAVQRRRLALLALLATSGSIARDKLIAYLWPEVDADRGRHLLSDSIYRINHALGAETVLAAGDELRLRGELLPSDVARFEEALGAERPAEAVALYGGPFLDGFFLDDAPEFERWAEGERARLARLYAAALESLAEAAEDDGEPKRATECWYRLATHDPLSPRVALRLMQALDAAGERAAALRHARVHRALFQEEFGAGPDPAVAALEDRLRAAPAPVAAPSTAPEERVPEPRSGCGDTADPVPPAASPAPSGGAGDAGGAEARRAPQNRRVRQVWAPRAVLLLVPLLLGVALWYRGDEPAAATPVRAVAVLPFADHSPARDHAYFASGITEEVASSLTRMRGLRIVAHTPALPADGPDVQEVGRRLGVEAVLHGSVSRWGDSVRINARLIRVADRAYLWSEGYTSEMGSVFAIQDSISHAIAATLTERLVGTGAPSAEPSAAEVEAYNLYLRGRYAWHRRTEQSLAEAVTHFRRAVELAPRYARAHAGLADAYAVQGFYDFRPPDEVFPRAEAAARRALELDPGLAHPHATLGYVDLYYHWRWRDAERAFRRAIALDPGYSTAHQWYANHLAAMGRFDEAERSMRRAMELDPLSLIANAALSWVHYMAGDYDRAIEQSEHTLEMDPGFSLAYLWNAMSREQLGRHGEAVRLLKRSLALAPGSAVTAAALAHVHATAGDTARARELLRQLLAIEEHYVPSYEIAKVHLALGERDAALERLEQAYQQRSHSMAFLRVDPQLTPLRSDPRFLALLRGTGHHP